MATHRASATNGEALNALLAAKAEINTMLARPKVLATTISLPTLTPVGRRWHPDPLRQPAASDQRNGGIHALGHAF